ncbi:Protein kinase domain - like 10 [Theobroma cacao]|nr:Protein kinase domain - like 10 [Theobroma cacao]
MKERRLKLIPMQFSASKQPYWRWVFLLVFPLLLSSSFSDPRISNAGLLCGHSRPSNGTNLIPNFSEAMRGLSQAINNSHFASYHLNSTSPMYVLAQCHQDLSQTDCLLCYAAARTTLPRCLPSVSGRIFLDGCFLRYDNYSFYQESVSSSLDNVSCSPDEATVFDGDSKRVNLFGRSVDYAVGNMTRIALRNGGFGTVGMNGVYALAQCWKSVPAEGCRECLEKAAKAVRGCVPKEEGRGMNTGCYLRYSTNKFYSKEGEAKHDHEIAVIVAIVSSIAAFLMVSLSAAYATYARLSKRKEDEKKTNLVKWKQRFDIIVGTAEGLAHLHGGGSHVRLIHRDIKSSNVLLDENLNPKIADFGLVRCLATDKSHLSTGVAGTLGYMAPEYLVRGQLTEKADVYSFGVLALEIVCGKRNTTFTKDSGSLLQTVWALYRSNRLAEAVDYSIKDDTSAKEAPDVLQIGLLCTQASVSLRPSMAQVVQMLTDKDCEIPSPNQPPFLNASVLDPTSSTRSNSTDSFTTNAVRKIQDSGTSSEPSRTLSSDEASRSQ